jgi:hypothetical protein
MLDPERYYPPDRNILGVRLVEVVNNICQIQQQLHDALVEEHRVRYHTFQTSLETSVSGREREADIQAFAQWCAVQDCRLELVTLQEERDLLRDLLELAHASGR